MKTFDGPPPGDGGDWTIRLLAEARKGDAGARERLMRHYLPILSRWAHGKLPRAARDLYDTGDVVQMTLLKALKQVDGFEPRHEGAFLSYLRTIVMNHVRDMARRSKTRPKREDLPEEVPEPPAGSSLDNMVDVNLLEVYESALLKLSDEDYQAVVLRLEFDYDYRQLAEALGKPSWNAARMAVTRALERLRDLTRKETGRTSG